MTSNFGSERKMSFRLGEEFAFEHDFGGGSGLAFSMAGLPFLTYTEHEGKLMRTRVQVGHKAEWGGTCKLDIIGTADKMLPTADKMRQLGLDKSGCVAVFRTDTLKAHLPRGEYVQ